MLKPWNQQLHGQLQALHSGPLDRYFLKTKEDERTIGPFRIRYGYANLFGDAKFASELFLGRQQIVIGAVGKPGFALLSQRLEKAVFEQSNVPRVSFKSIQMTDPNHTNAVALEPP